MFSIEGIPNLLELNTDKVNVSLFIFIDFKKYKNIMSNKLSW